MIYLGIYNETFMKILFFNMPAGYTVTWCTKASLEMSGSSICRFNVSVLSPQTLP